MPVMEIWKVTAEVDLSRSMSALSRVSNHLLALNFHVGRVSRKDHWDLLELVSQIPVDRLQIPYQLRNHNLDQFGDVRRKRDRSWFGTLIESCFAQVSEAVPS